MVDRVALILQEDGSFVPEDELVAGEYSVNTRLDQGTVVGENRRGGTSEVRLGPDEYLLLGDNRPLASDSRSWGVVGRERISAVVILRYWPLRRLGRP
jgi:signal peptidase I